MLPGPAAMRKAAGLTDKGTSEILEIMAMLCDSGNSIPAQRGLGYEEALDLAQYILEEKR